MILLDLDTVYDHVTFWEVPVETALFFETAEQIYARIFRSMRPLMAVPAISVKYPRYANANSRIRLCNGSLHVSISDLLQPAPAPVQEALAAILLAKLFRRQPDQQALDLYYRYLNRAEVRRTLQQAKKERGRKVISDACGNFFDLNILFTELNRTYFDGLLPEPRLGWSVRASRGTLGHYDPAHHMIVLSKVLDSASAPELIVKYVLFHEMLHIQYPTEQQGTRRCIHTKAFKEAERIFTGFRTAREALRTFVVNQTI